MLLQQKQKGHTFILSSSLVKTMTASSFSSLLEMTVLQFERLLELVQEPLTKRSIREPLSPEHRLCILCKLLHGNFYVSKSTVSKVIRDTCKIIWDKLSPIYLPRSTMNDFKRYSRDFQELWNMPNYFEAIDGKHIVIQAPYNTGTSFFNYKKTFSILLMAIGDANDGRVFKELAFEIAFDNNEVEILDDSCLPGTDIKFPYYMVADETFPLKSYIMRPYPGTRVIENSFGILASRWRIFRSTIIAHVDTAEWIVCAGLCLHNFLRKSELMLKAENATYCPSNYNVTFKNVGRIGTNNAHKNITLRNTLAKYFIFSEGAVSWQEAYITRGSF
ncbi:hypothetical protein ACFW04_013965 [Cataglyphis niger]